MVIISMLMFAFRAEAGYYRQVTKKNVTQLIEVANFPDYEKVPVLDSLGKDTKADIRLYIEASNPKKDKFAIFNIESENMASRDVHVSFQAMFYDQAGQVIGVAHLGGKVEAQKKKSFIAGMQYAPPELLKEIRSVEIMYYEW